MKATFGQIQEFIRVNGESLETVLWINGLDETEAQAYKVKHQQVIKDGWFLFEGEKRNKPYVRLEGKWFYEDADLNESEIEIFRFLKYFKPDTSEA